jgi:hypothetical protein
VSIWGQEMNIAQGDMPILPHHVPKIPAIAPTRWVHYLHNITVAQVRKDRLKEPVPAVYVRLACSDLLSH